MDVSSVSSINGVAGAAAVDPQARIQAQKALTQSQQQDELARQQTIKEAAQRAAAQQEQQAEELRRQQAQEAGQKQVVGSKGGVLNVFA